MKDRHKIMTFKGMHVPSRPIEDVLSALCMDSAITDEEFAADLQLLVSGKMSPEEHRAYLKGKYTHQAA
ncbi:MAG: hypothetical protein MK052_10040 [Alphaproteobacteria bacterium]|nr:hypothetical protein [Alphaproteobacteria bacterium]